MQFSRIISYSDLDSQLNVSFLSLARFIEDSTTEFLRVNHLSGIELNEKHSSILVVIKNHIFFKGKCSLNDKITSNVTCINKNNNSITLKTLLQLNEKEIVTSYIQLVSISMKERKLVGLSSYYGFSLLKEKKEENNPFTRFKISTDINQLTKNIKVESTDIDYSKHLNNIIYLRNYANMLTSEELSLLKLKEIEINYIKEIKENDDVSLLLSKEDNILYFSSYLNDELVNKAKFILSY